MTEGYSTQNWVKIEQAAYALKGSSGRVGAGKIHYACFHICDAYHKGDFKSMLVYYPLIIEAVIEFRRYSRELIAGVKQQDYEESESVSNVTLRRFEKTYFPVLLSAGVSVRLTKRRLRL